jgi:hypothetical protein
LSRAFELESVSPSSSSQSWTTHLRKRQPKIKPTQDVVLTMTTPAEITQGLDLSEPLLPPEDTPEAYRKGDNIAVQLETGPIQIDIERGRHVFFRGNLREFAFL